MQENIQKYSPIKQRILLYIDYIDISKREFYAKSGISRGTLDNITGITEDTLAKFIATYPNIDLVWLITGKGEMLKSEENPRAKSEITGMVREPSVAIETKKNGCNLCAAKDIRIADLEKTIRLLEKLIASLEREIDHCKKP